MTCMSICSLNAPLVMVLPSDIEQPYRMLVGYRFDWREKVGKVECDCQIIEEVYRPWLGWHWNHLPECAIEKHLRRYPGIHNLVPNAGGVIVYAD